MSRYVPLCFALPVVLAGCVGGRGGGQLTASERALMHGPTISEQMRRIPRKPENVAVTSATADRAVLSQPDAAPGNLDEPADGATTPLELDSVAQNLLKHIKTAVKHADGDLSYKDMRSLESSASGILLHSRELLTVFDRRATNARITSEIMTRKKDGDDGDAVGQDAELAALQEWVTVAERVERSATWFNRGVQTKAPELVRKGWAALLEAGRQLPQIRAGIDMMALKKRR